MEAKKLTNHPSRGELSPRDEAACRRGAELLARDYRGREAEAYREIVENDKSDIDACGALVVWFDAPSVGTSMEILYAWERNIPVVLIDRSTRPLSPWLRYHTREIVSDIQVAVSSLEKLTL